MTSDSAQVQPQDDASGQRARRRWWDSLLAAPDGSLTDSAYGLNFKTEIEERYLDEHEQHTVRMARIALIMGTVLYGVFGLLDPWVFPYTLKETWFIRFALIEPIMVVNTLLSFTRVARRYLQPLLMWHAIICAFGVYLQLAVALPTEPGYTAYYSGLLLITLWAYTIARLRLFYASLTGWLITLIYVAVAGLEQGMLGHDAMLRAQFINNLFFLVSSNLLGMIAGYKLADAAVAQTSLREKLQRMATVDRLSGLLTRQAMQEVLQRTVGQAQRQNTGFCLLLCDIDRFKIINDNYGHQAGDRVIAATAAALRGALRAEDWASRWGGEEFLCLLPASACEGGHGIAERVRGAVAARPVVLDDGRMVQVTVSIGVACMPTAGTTLQELLARVDCALYDAKAGGRNRVVRASSQVQNRYFMANEIDQAIGDDRLRPAYQPIVRLQDGAVVAEEALARLVQADGQMLEAGRFIMQASQLHLAHRVDHAIMRQALDQCAARVFSGAAFLPSLVNISAHLLRHPDLVEDLLERARAIRLACDERNGAPMPLVIEITERELLDDLKEARRHLTPFLDCGVRLALDDFGSGYSSFHYLAELPFSFLKISGDLVSQVNSNPRAWRILHGIQELARDMEVLTIAEGVEDRATADTLRTIGIDWVQGYLYGHPRLPEPAIIPAA